MGVLADLRCRLRALFTRDRVERELDDELSFHLEMAVAERIARGEAPASARRGALAEFGGLEQVKEECRDERGVRWLEDLAADLRYGARSLARSPGYAAAVVATLALAIGANSAIFSVVHAVLLKPLPYAGGDRLVRLHQRALPAGFEEVELSVAELADYRARVGAFEALVEFHGMSFTLLSHGEPERVRTGVVSADYFDVLGVEPVAGRTFVADDDLPGAPAVLVLSHSYSLRRFGGDRAAVGTVVEMNDRAHTIVGVLPPVPLVPEDQDVYMPVSACPYRSAPAFVANRDRRMMSALARLRPEVSAAAAAAETAAVAQAMAAEHPEIYPPAAGFTAEVVPLGDELSRAARPTFLVLLAAVGLVLLIACANVASLALARRLRRRQELAVRAALGASRGRLARQLLTEAVLLALAAGALGLALAAGALDLLTAFAARYSPRAAEIGLDPAVLGFTLGVSLAAGLGFGALPAFAHGQPFGGLAASGGGRIASGGGLRRALVVVQLAVSLVLLAAAGLAARSLWALHRVDPGFDPGDVLTASIALNWTRYDDGAKARAFYLELLERVHGPGVASAAVAGTFPLDEDGPGRRRWQAEGQPPADPELAPLADLFLVSEEYFDVLGMPLVAGRPFAATDDAGAPAVAVVGRALARRWGADPVGRRISIDEGESWLTVIGVVGDVRQHGLDREAGEAIYLPFRQGPGYAGRLLVRGDGDPRRLTARVREAVRAIDPEQPVSDVRTLEQVRAASLAPPRLTASLLAAFALLALAIAATGVAGLMAYAVGQRSHEIGIRLALGAARGRVVAMIVGQGLALAAAGAALGLAAALGATRLLEDLLFRVEPTDPLTLGAVTAALIAVAAAACLLPARRATAIDPVRALRCE
jgi:predicted permease